MFKSKWIVSQLQQHLLERKVLDDTTIVQQEMLRQYSNFHNFK